MRSLSLADAYPRRVAIRWGVDRLGVFFSLCCAVHCLAAPVLFLLLPSFGEAWSHPVIHAAAALVVIPLAGYGIAMGFRRHGRKWIVACGMGGAALILGAAVIPFFKESWGEPTAPVLDSPVSDLHPEDAEEFVFTVEEEFSEQEPVASDVEIQTTPCASHCCPTISADGDGGWKLQFPLASLLSIAGGITLIAAHAGNLCCCSRCRGRQQTVV